MVVAIPMEVKWLLHWFIFELTMLQVSAKAGFPGEIATLVTRQSQTILSKKISLAVVGKSGSSQGKSGDGISLRSKLHAYFFY